MTDGILLAELQRDRMLRRYDTIIIDEAHERSLNIDFLLGYLKQLLPRRPDLKLVITSATIDPERFARHFADRRHAGPIIEVSGRTYPVEVRYRPLVEAGRARRARASASSATRPRRSSTRSRSCAAEGPGDILVFLPGEREIRDTADALERPDVDPAAPSRSCRSTPGSPPPSSTGSSPRTPDARVVLATNVAETSLTVPGIRYVVDTGIARISRYSSRTKVQRLPIEPISQASANQRSGRCGRVEAGIAIRLYSEEDFESPAGVHRPGDPAHQPGLGDPADDRRSGSATSPAFPFVEPPDRRNVTAGVQLLEELGALDADGVGRPAAGGSPRARAGSWPGCRSTRGWRRMILEADRLGCAARGARDRRGPVASRTRASGRWSSRPQADQLHARFSRRHSDFLTWLNLWRYLREQQRELSSSAFRRMCKRGVPQLPAGPRVAGLRVPAAAGRASELGLDRSADGPGRRAATPTASTRRCWPGCSRTSGCATPRSASTSAPAAPGSRSSRARRCSGSSRSW